ncbi:MAG: ribosomal protein S18-alanine N-acetyltransferase [Streptococcaceae bacterium]|jgi:ribosomal-protein-alanine N-acetyltransferase|nr:ribosomal protein S18-alanine N-acetyltransferase [Streptococcaceae bacterium]
MIALYGGEKLEATSTALYELLAGLYPKSPWSSAQIISELTSPSHVCYLAYSKSSEIIGFLSATVVQGETEITNLAVRKDHQKQGIATALIGQLDNPILLEVRASNSPARKLYEKLGFQSFLIRKNYYQDPADDAILMKRDL